MTRCLPAQSPSFPPRSGDPYVRAPAAASIVCTGLDFAWPDGTPVLEDFPLTVGPGRTGLIGLNGAGKSTLLKLIAGELTPSAGGVKVAGEVGYLPQHAPLDTHLRVDEVLGIAGARAALHAIEGGDAREEHFTALGDDWDVEERARATLDQLGLPGLDLDRTIGEVSGGECVLLRLAALLLRRPDVLLLDEPTNNLDRAARERLYTAVDGWSKVLVVVSHDRELLQLVDRIADLRDGEVHWYGGNFQAYEQALAVEQEAAERMLRVAEADVQRQKRELSDAQVKLARRVRYGNKMSAAKREPKIVMNERKRAAQVSAGKHRTLHTERLKEARERLDEAAEAVRDDDEIRIDLPHTAVPPAGPCSASTPCEPATAPPPTWRSAAPNGSRSPVATAPARPPCCAPSPARSRRRPARPGSTFPTASCRSASMSSTMR